MIVKSSGGNAEPKTMDALFIQLQSGLARECVYQEIKRRQAFQSLGKRRKIKNEKISQFYKKKKLAKKVYE